MADLIAVLIGVLVCIPLWLFVILDDDTGGPTEEKP